MNTEFADKCPLVYSFELYIDLLFRLVMMWAREDVDLFEEGGADADADAGAGAQSCANGQC